MSTRPEVELKLITNSKKEKFLKCHEEVFKNEYFIEATKLLTTQSTLSIKDDPEGEEFILTVMDTTEGKSRATAYFDSKMSRDLALNILKTSISYLDNYED